MVQKQPRRKNYRKKPLSKAQYKQVAKIANKQIHKQAELKCLTNYPSNLTLSHSAPTITQWLPFPAEGTAADERIGDSIYIRGFQTRGILDCQTDQALVARLILIQWLEDDTVAPVLGDIFDSGAKYLTAPYKPNPTKQYKVLSDRLYMWDSNVTNAPKLWSIDVKKFGRYKVDYKAAGYTNGNFYLIHYTDAPSAIGQMSSIVTRLRYYDN